MKKTVLTFDVDGLWAQEQLWGSLAKTKINELKREDHVLKKGVPEVLNILKRKKIKATFFIVGQNIENHPKEHLTIAKEDHEIASHTYSHPISLSKLTFSEKKEEIEKNEKIIKKYLGMKPVGFRAPTYSIDQEVVNILKRRKYIYDSSVVPTFIPGFTKVQNLFAPKEPYFPSSNILRRGGNKFLEIPISTYLMFPLMGTAVYNLGKTYFSIISKLVSLQNKPLILNFHIRDFVKIRRGAFWLPSHRRRLEVFNYLIKKLIKKYEFLTLKQLSKDYKIS